MADLTKRGFTVAVPFGDNARYDLLVDDGKGIKRVQVKYSECKDGAITVKFRSSNRTYTWDELDKLAVYEPLTQTCYYLGPEEMGARTSIVLRLEATGNNQARHIVWAEEYKEW